MILQFHTLVPVDRLMQAPGWAQPQVPSDLVLAMMQLVLSPALNTGGPDDALAELEARWPGFTAGWRAP